MGSGKYYENNSYMAKSESTKVSQNGYVLFSLYIYIYIYIYKLTFKTDTKTSQEHCIPKCNNNTEKGWTYQRSSLQDSYVLTHQFWLTSKYLHQLCADT